MDRLQDKVILVFGGTSGIGKAISQGFVEEGALVVPTSRSREKIEQTVSDLKGKGNNWTDVITTDVTRKNDIEHICNAILKKYKKIDVMVCCAGTYLKKPAEEISEEEWRDVLDTNLNGTFLTNSVVGKIMLNQAKGSIINIGSLGSVVALSNTLPYCVSKAGVLMLSQSLSTEWCHRGVRVNTIIPGVFPTDLNKKALSDPIRVKNILNRTPMKRLGNLEELVGASVFLASDESNFVSGIALPVDGGFLASSGF